jgi:ribose transport system permease protein
MATRLGAANPSQGIGIEFDGIAAAVVGGASLAGGKGSVWGTLGGAVIIAILRNGLNMAGLPMALQMVILGMIIIAIVTIDSLRS